MSRQIDPKALQDAIDKIEIGELQSRYMFAIDWHDPHVYAEVFTEDAVLEWPEGKAEGRENIRNAVIRIGQFYGRLAEAAKPNKAARLRHFVTNRVIRIEGDSAYAVAYWFDINNDNQPRWPYVAGYGYYEDDLIRTAEGWRFTRRNVVNELTAISPAENPGW